MHKPILLFCLLCLSLLPALHAQPVPLIAVTVSDAGRVSTTVTKLAQVLRLWAASSAAWVTGIGPPRG